MFDPKVNIIYSTNNIKTEKNDQYIREALGYRD